MARERPCLRGCSRSDTRVGAAGLLQLWARPVGRDEGAPEALTAGEVRPAHPSSSDPAQAERGSSTNSSNLA